MQGAHLYDTRDLGDARYVLMAQSCMLRIPVWEPFPSDGLCEASEQIYSHRELLEEAHDLGFLRVFRITDESIDAIE